MNTSALLILRESSESHNDLITMWREGQKKDDKRIEDWYTTFFSEYGKKIDRNIINSNNRNSSMEI